jgi:hypothetical protein
VGLSIPAAAALTGVLLLSSAALDGSAAADAACEISVRDETPGVYPGGISVHQDCVRTPA